MHGCVARRRTLLLALVAAMLVIAFPGAPAWAHEGDVTETGDVTHTDTPTELSDTDIQETVASAWLSPEGAQTIEAAPPMTWCGTARTTDDTANAAYPASDAQFKIIYAYPADRPNRFAQWAGALQSNASLASSFVSLQPGSTRAPRFDMGTSCGPQYLDIQTVALPQPRSAYINNLGAVANAVAAVVNQAPGGPRKYMILADTLGAYLFGNANVWGDDRPGAENANNASTARGAIWIPDGTTPPASGSYWPTGFLHEMTHQIGGVQNSAPHTTQGFHCYDGADVMCYNDGAAKGSLYTVAACGTGGGMQTFTTLSETFDCEQDDYFNPAPPAGSYIETHWNVYNSIYMGECSALGTCATTPSPVSTSPPVVTRSGQTLTTTTGAWTGATSFTYVWQRCQNGSCRSVYGAWSNTYALTSADIGYSLRAVVTATNLGGGSGYGRSAQTAVIGAAPANTAPPVVSGTAAVGATLSTSIGTWTGAPSSFAYAWQRCQGAGCSTIAGETAATYVVTSADGNFTLRSVVTAANDEWQTNASSAQTAVVQTTPANTTAPSITGTTTSGATLTADKGAWTGGSLSYAYQWQRNGAGSWADIAGATGATYRLASADVGATVRVRVVATNSVDSTSATSAATAQVIGVPVGEGPYQSAVAASSPVAWYRFDEAAGATTVVNSGSAGAAMNLTRTGNVTLSAPGYQSGSRAALFGGGSDYLQQAASTTTVAGTFTVELLRSQTSAGGAPLSTRQSADLGYAWQCSASASTGGCGQVVGTGSGWLTTSGSFATTKLDSAWHHAAAVITPTGYTTYVDGLPTGSGSWMGTPLLLNATHRLTLGGTFNAGSTLLERFAGSLDEVAIYNTALSAAAVQAHATAGGFGAPPAVNTSAPAVSGQTTVGSTLTADRGTWTGATSYAYQWQRNTGAGWSDIAGATSTTYTLAATDFDATIRVQVSAGATTASSSATAAVTSASPPVSTTAPSITGAATSGSTLTANKGAWTCAGSHAYQWQRNSAGSWADIAGATGATYTLAGADVGATVRVQVVATNTAGSTTASSAATATVTAVPVGEGAYQSAVAASAPVAWYRFSDAPGATTVVNSGSAGAAMNLTRTGNVALSAPGYQSGSKAASFGGASDYLQQGTTATNIAGTFTVEMLRSQASAAATPFSTRQSADLGYAWQCAASASTGGCGQVVGTGSSWLTTSGSFATTALTSAWHHVAAVITPTGYTTYVDGVQTGSGSWSGTPLLLNATHKLTLGGTFNGGSTLLERFAGSLDEVAVYNTALSAGTVQAHATAAGF
jgi:hypothetical protein